MLRVAFRDVSRLAIIHQASRGTVFTGQIPNWHPQLPRQMDLGLHSPALLPAGEHQHQKLIAAPQQLAICAFPELPGGREAMSGDRMAVRYGTEYNLPGAEQRRRRAASSLEASVAHARIGMGVGGGEVDDVVVGCRGGDRGVAAGKCGSCSHVSPV